MATQQTLRKVIVVKIEAGSDSDGLFYSMYNGLMTLLNNNPLIRVVTVDSFAALLLEIAAKPSVLLFTNELVAKRRQILDIMKSFVSSGGLAIFGCHFSSFTRPKNMDILFSSLGLPWKHSAYNRTTFGITTVGKFILTGFDEKPFSVKAVQLSGVRPEEALYTPLQGSQTQSHVFLPEATDPNLAMAAFAKIGQGAIAYIGDVNAEDMSLRLTNALCLANW